MKPKKKLDLLDQYERKCGKEIWTLNIDGLLPGEEGYRTALHQREIDQTGHLAMGTFRPKDEKYVFCALSAFNWRINDIMEHFKFENVHKTMKLLDWKYKREKEFIPDIPYLQAEVLWNLRVLVARYVKELQAVAKGKKKEADLTRREKMEYGGFIFERDDLDLNALFYVTKV